ncbi:3'-5' exonuclease [Mangrovimonas spongiae]|uniref:3'-5' exonuclease n=1 Tax=Mangrovimonas spongiae TaxID=2494697 RepID=A0A3R9UUB2_9FLAO|nr:3'-5' exonuclease [Mangrovimonas spongiae]RSK40318.1 3'-5' exonuclease [Mangrovimonas spongiae]
MFNWFKKRAKQFTLPEFWNEYENSFSPDTHKDLKSARFVVLDTETTGFSYSKDRILCIGAVEILNYEIQIAHSFEIYIKQERFNEKTVEIHGIIKNERIKTLTEYEAIEKFLEYLGNAIIIAHHAKFDVTMINKMLERHGFPHLKNKILDTVRLYNATRIKTNFNRQEELSLDNIADKYLLDVSDRHTAAGDALITALIFLKTTTILKNKKGMTLKTLFKV